MRLWLVMLALASSALAMDSDLYFYLNENKARCFLEELPAQTILIGDYKSPEKGKSIDVVVYDPEGKRVYSEPAEEKGRFAFHSVVSGEHKVCVQSVKEKPWPVRSKTAKFHLRLEIHGKDAEISTDIAKKEHLTSLERELEELDNNVDLVLKRLEFSKNQEQHFREQTERINSRIMWWSLFQTTLVFLSGIWQIVHLKNFFRAKKLV